MKRLIVLSCGLLLMCNVLSAYPISPRPLRKLILESPFIVVGHVEKVDTIKQKLGSGKHRWTGLSAMARIRVIEVLQGEVREKIIYVEFEPYMICPAPAVYLPNTKVVAFLNRSEKGKYSTHALSYGSKTLSDDGIAAYRARILEMQEILRISDHHQQFMETVSWLVRCAASKHTRWEGTYELSPRSDFMSFYDREGNEQFDLMLSREDRKSLRAALLTTKEIDYDDLGLVDLVYNGERDEIYNMMLSRLERARTEPCWYAPYLMERLSYVNRSPELEDIMKQYSDSLYSIRETDGTKAQELLEMFLEKVR